MGEAVEAAANSITLSAWTSSGPKRVGIEPAGGAAGSAGWWATGLEAGWVMIGSGLLW
jgi:hypothetical protein